MDFVNQLILSKDNVSEQLRLLRKHKDNKSVREYIKSLEETEHLTDYMRYMIDRYYYGNKDAVKCKKNCVERMFKVLLRPVKMNNRSYSETELKIGDKVFIINGPFNGIEGQIKKVKNDTSEFDVEVNLFKESFVVKIEFEYVVKKD